MIGKDVDVPVRSRYGQENAMPEDIVLSLLRRQGKNRRKGVWKEGG